MKKLTVFISTGVLLIILSACSIFPSPSSVKIHYYDIGVPGKNYKPKVSMQILPFIGGVGDENRMVFRKSSNSIEFDSYNRWANIPSKMVQCYLTLAFSNNNSDIAYSMTGEVLKFEGDLDKKTANIAVKIIISSRKNLDRDEKYSSQFVYTSSVPVKKESAHAYAIAMEKAMKDITGQIAKQIQKLKSK